MCVWEREGERCECFWSNLLAAVREGARERDEHSLHSKLTCSVSPFKSKPPAEKTPRMSVRLCESNNGSVYSRFVTRAKRARDPTPNDRASLRINLKMPSKPPLLLLACSTTPDEVERGVLVTHGAGTKALAGTASVASTSMTREGL